MVKRYRCYKSAPLENCNHSIFIDCFCDHNLYCSRKRAKCSKLMRCCMDESLWRRNDKEMSLKCFASKSRRCRKANWQRKCFPSVAYCSSAFDKCSLTEAFASVPKKIEVEFSLEMTKNGYKLQSSTATVSSLFRTEHILMAKHIALLLIVMSTCWLCIVHCQCTIAHAHAYIPYPSRNTNRSVQLSFLAFITCDRFFIRLMTITMATGRL